MVPRRTEDVSGTRQETTFSLQQSFCPVTLTPDPQTLTYFRAAGAFRKGGPQTEVGSSLSSDTYTYYYSSELVIIEALDGLCSLGLRV